MLEIKIIAIKMKNAFFKRIRGLKNIKEWISDSKKVEITKTEKKNNLKKAVRTEHSESFGQYKIINPIQTLTDIKGETDSNTIIVGDFNTPLTPMDRSSK